MLVAQQTHAASLAAQTTVIDVLLVHEGLALAMAADAAGLDADVDRIRRLGRHTFLLARRVAVARSRTSARPRAARRAGSMRCATRGFVDRAARGEWRVADPMLRRRLAEDPTA